MQATAGVPRPGHREERDDRLGRASAQTQFRRPPSLARIRRWHSPSSFLARQRAWAARLAEGRGATLSPPLFGLHPTDGSEITV